jgi:hypothetical protein
MQHVLKCHEIVKNDFVSGQNFFLTSPEKDNTLQA